MSVTESERNKLYNWFEEHMGDARADTLMRLLPPVGWADVATKRDLDALEQRLDTRIDTLATRIDTLATKDELHQLGAALRGELHDLRGEMQQMRGDLQQTFIRWMFAAHGATVALLGLLIAATR